MKLLKVVAVTVATVFGAACSTSALWANPGDNQLIEEPACHPMTVANQALRKMPGFQMTWDTLVEDESQRVSAHVEAIIDHGLEYRRTAPYAAWRVKPVVLVDPPRSECHRLREEMLDGVKTVVISYYKLHPDYGTQEWKCITWLEIPDYRNKRMECASVHPADQTKISVHWFYRTDIEPPTP